MTQEHEV